MFSKCLLQIPMHLTYPWFCRWTRAQTFPRSRRHERPNCSQSGARSPEAAAAHPVGVKKVALTSAAATTNTNSHWTNPWISARDDQSCLQLSQAQLTRTESTDSPFHATAPPPSVSVRLHEILFVHVYNYVAGCLNLSSLAPILWQCDWMGIVVLASEVLNRPWSLLGCLAVGDNIPEGDWATASGQLGSSNKNEYFA